jgi:ribose 5-phosphate isomerase B
LRIAIGSDQIGAGLRAAIMKDVAARHRLDAELVDLTPTDARMVFGPELAELVALAVVRGEADRGILVCGSGVGMSIAANKIPGIRAALCPDLATAVHARQSSDCQVLVLGSHVVVPQRAIEIVDAWISVEYQSNPRRDQRLTDLSQLERRYLGRLQTPGDGPGHSLVSEARSSGG